VTALYRAWPALLFAGCALFSGDRAVRDGWRSDWNQRVDGAQSGWQHPCATRPFIAWADDFLSACQGESAPPECDARRDWVGERVKQCRAWTAWQLRNFNQHRRSEASAPSMRVE
jgi:hypothetical protein